MTTSVKAPTMGESISEAIVAKWFKKEGDAVAADELIAELETDKVNLEVTAPKAGRLGKIITPKGAKVAPGDVMAEVEEGAGAAPVAAEKSAKPAAAESAFSPAVRRVVEENKVDVSAIEGTGRGGRLTKADVLTAAVAPAVAAKPAAVVPMPAAANLPAAPRVSPTLMVAGERREERVPMSRLRKTIATRLKSAQNTAAMLTTYNEVDLHAINDLRKQYKDSFEKKHGVKLGYMAFFTKAVVAALKEWPAVNAEIDGEDIVYKYYYDIGMAVSTEKGLMVPVLRNADTLSFAGVEQAIGDFAKRAREGGIRPDELVGGTFSITNGGVFGSLLNMPIINPPQVGILGMNTIKERPVVVNGEIVARPMMFIALTYDHRIIDGREAVSFLVKVKECLEDPGRLLLGV